MFQIVLGYSQLLFEQNNKLGILQIQIGMKSQGLSTLIPPHSPLYYLGLILYLLLYLSAVKLVVH